VIGRRSLQIVSATLFVLSLKARQKRALKDNGREPKSTVCEFMATDFCRAYSAVVLLRST
jgi:hypothetical protein